MTTLNASRPSGRGSAAPGAHRRHRLRAAGAPSEVVAASGWTRLVEAERLPLLPGVEELIVGGAIAGGTRRNRDDARQVRAGEVAEARRWVACDAQTSGGLLVAPAPDAAIALVEGSRRRPLRGPRS